MITLIYGPVCSGKTSELLRLLERSYISRKNVILIRPPTDTRDFLSHCNRDISWLNVVYDDLKCDHDFSQYDVIGLDEVQFQNDAKDFCIKHALCRKDIVMAGLHSSSELEMFDSIIDVIPICDKIIKLNAICIDCGSEYGSYSYYLGGQKSEKVEVGGTDKYSSLCFRCYMARLVAKSTNI